MRRPAARLSRPALLGALTVAALATSAHAALRAQNGSIPRRATRTHALHVGMDDHYLTVRGSGRSGDDLDCWIYEDGELVDSDTDGTDYCILETPGYGTHRLVIRNYGPTTNYYVVRQLETLD